MKSDKLFDTHWSKVDITSSSVRYDELWDYLPDDIASILDIGGGVGAMYDSLQRSRKSGTSYAVLDSSKCAIERAKSRGLSGTIHNLDHGKMSFQDNSYDCVCLLDVLEHLRNPWEVLADAARVSNKYVFVHGPNFAYWKCRLDALMGRPNRQMTIDKHGAVVDANGNHVSHIYFITYRNILYWADKVGLVPIKQRVFWYRRYSLFRWPLELLFRNWGSQYQIVFEKKK